MSKEIKESNLAPGLQIIRKTEETAPKKQRVAAYVRVSKNIEEQETSFEIQMDSYYRLITSHPDWELVEIYADKGKTGTSVLKRNGFNKMIEDAREGKIDLILAKSVSRFARNTVDTLNYTRELRSIGVSVFFEKEKVNTGSLTSEMLLTVFAAFSQNESYVFSSSMKQSIRERYKYGQPKWTKVYGFKRESRNKWVIDEETAPVVRKIYDLYVRGYTVVMIKDKLNEEGIPSPYGVLWDATAVSVTLRSEKARGDFLMQKYYTVDHLTHEKKPNRNAEVEQYYKTDDHEAIVDRDTAEFADLIRKSRDCHKGSRQYPYYGFLRCPICGEKMVCFYLVSKGPKRAWTCGGCGDAGLRKDRTDCPPFSVRDIYISEAMNRILPRVPKEYKHLLEDVKELGGITAYFLKNAVEKITFSSDWEKLIVYWKNGEKVSTKMKYEAPSDHPAGEVRHEGKEYFIGNMQIEPCAVYHVRESVEAKKLIVQNTMITPDETGYVVVLSPKKGEMNDEQSTD